MEYNNNGELFDYIVKETRYKLIKFFKKKKKICINDYYYLIKDYLKQQHANSCIN